MKNYTLKKWNKGFWIILAVAILLRIIWLSEFPHAKYTRDSNSYMSVTHDLIETGKTNQGSRTLGYPLFMLPIISITGDYLAVVLVQITLGILMSIILYLTFWELYPNQKLSLWFFGLIISCGYNIHYETLIMTELLLTFFITICFWLIVRLHKEPKISYFLWLGIASGIATIIKPAVIYFIVFGLIISILVYYKTKGKFKKILISSIMFYIPYLTFLGGQTTFNQYHNNFFGLTNVGGVHLFASSAHLTDLNSPNNQEIKKKIKPYIIKYRTLYKEGKKTLNWIIYRKDGPSKVIKDYTGTQLKYDKLSKELALEAIMSSPFLFAYDKAKVFFKLLFGPGSIGLGLAESHDMLLKKSWSSLPKVAAYNKTHPKVDLKINLVTSGREWINPFNSLGSFVRGLYLILPSILPTIWGIGLILSFYFLFIRYKTFPIISVMLTGYILIPIHLAVHSLIVPTMRYVYPVYSIMIFFTFILLAEWVNKKRKAVQ